MISCVYNFDLFNPHSVRGWSQEKNIPTFDYGNEDDFKLYLVEHGFEPKPWMCYVHAVWSSPGGVTIYHHKNKELFYVEYPLSDFTTNPDIIVANFPSLMEFISRYVPAMLLDHMSMNAEK